MTVKTTQIDSGLDSILLDSVQKAEPVVEQVLGNAAVRVEVTWEPGPVDCAGEPTARLRLTDAGVTRTEDFTAWDLEDEVVLGRKLRRLWDRILAERMRTQWQRVLQSLAEPEEG